MKRVKPIIVAALVALSVLVLSTCGAIEDLIANTAPVGVYVGVVSLATDGGTPVRDLVRGSGKSNTLTSDKLIYLDALSMSDNSFDTVLAGYDATTASPPKTSPLFLAVDHVIEDLKRSESWLSSKLDSITIVTFTDGYEQGSATWAMQSVGGGYTLPIPGLSQKPGQSLDFYFGENVVKAKIDNTKIKGTVPINAYAVAVTQGIGADSTKQDETLKLISSGEVDTDPGLSPDLERDFNIIKLADWNSTTLSTRFKGIATNLNSIKYVTSLTLTFSGPSALVGADTYTEGFNFCVSFDGDPPSNSNPWIKGKMAMVNSKYQIQNISYSTGLSSEIPVGGGANESGRNGADVRFGIPKFTSAATIDYNNMKVYERVDATNWSNLYGGDASGTTRATYAPREQKSAIIYLVLDGTIASTNRGAVKTAAKAFIQELYNQSKEQN